MTNQLTAKDIIVQGHGADIADVYNALRCAAEDGHDTDKCNEAADCLEDRDGYLTGNLYDRALRVASGRRA